MYPKNITNNLRNKMCSNDQVLFIRLEYIIILQQQKNKKVVSNIYQNRNCMELMELMEELIEVSYSCDREANNRNTW